MGSRRLSSVNEEAVIRHKHQGLLQEYLVLQKECVSKKRKLKQAKDRKETLLDEIRFLKQRRGYLLKNKSQNLERQPDAVRSQKTDAKYKIVANERHISASEHALQNSQPAVGSMWNLGNAGKEDRGFAPLKQRKKPKDLLANGKKQAEKRKISWQDQLPLKV